MARPMNSATQGLCYFCFGTFPKKSMGLHLARCSSRVWDAEEIAARARTELTSYHVAAASRERPEYWLHAEVDGRASLSEIDVFLREIWLDCCPHPSQFEIRRATYHYPIQSSGQDVKLNDVLTKGLKFSYAFDPGHPSVIDLRVVSAWPISALHRPVWLAARNQPIGKLCFRCGQPAQHLLPWADQDPTYFCKACAGSVRSDLRPVYNSPREGICCYQGARKGTPFWR